MLHSTTYSIIIPFNLLLKPNLKGFQIKFYANIIPIEIRSIFSPLSNTIRGKISLESNHPKKTGNKIQFSN
jgi:hypothetical protein